jgi:flagellar capping protein FliD
MSPVSSGAYTQKMVEIKDKADQEFQDAMVAEIKKNVEEITVLVEKYNTEFALLKEVLSKSLTEKIKEVRDEERKKAALEKEEEIKKIDLEYQAAMK